MPWIAIFAVAGLCATLAAADGAFHNAQEVRQLSREAASLGHPVDVTATVTLTYPTQDRLFAQDKTAGIWVTLKQRLPLVPGDRIRIQGKTGPGKFAPMIEEASATILSHGSLPAPQKADLDPFRFPAYDALYVETTATVRSVYRVQNLWQMNLQHGEVRVPAFLPVALEPGPENRMPRPGDFLQIRGIASSVFNNKAQSLGPRLLVQDFQSVTLIRAGNHEDDKLPLTPLKDFLTFSARVTGQQRVRIRGAVTCVGSDGAICVQDGDYGVLVRSESKGNFRVGNAVEAIGFPTQGGYSPTLDDALIRPYGEAAAVTPIAVSLAGASSGRHDGRLVEVTGSLVVSEYVRSPLDGIPDRWSLTLSEGSQIFTAELERSKANGIPAIAVGSRIRVQGVCQITSPPSYQSRNAFFIRLRSGQDLQVLEPAPWWTRERAMFAVTGLAIIVALAVVWLTLLRRKVSQQTSFILSQIRLDTELSERYRDLFENSTDLVFTTDLAGRFTAVNRAANQIFGALGEGPPERNIQSFVADEDRPMLRDAFALLLGGERSVLRQMPILNPDGEPLILEMNCRLRYLDGRPRAVEIIARDVTQQKREQAALEQARLSAEAASRSKSEFLANMSHEIRTPMNGILGMVDLLLSTELSPDQQTHLQVVRTSAETLLVILNDILDFSKIEAGQMKLVRRPFLTTALIQDCLNIVSLQASRKGLELIQDLDPHLPAEFLGDASHLQQVLINLLGNAVKFTASGEIVLRIDWVETPGKTPRARFSVADTGIGIPPEQHQAIFGMFAQADGSSSRKYGGAGLGLAISSRLVSLMGGYLTVHSEPGKGSEFGFSLALEPRSEATIVTPNSLSGLYVRLEEPNARAAAAMARTLAHAGAEIIQDGNASIVITTDEDCVGTPKILLLPIGQPTPRSITSTAIVRKPASPQALLDAIGGATRTQSVLALEAASRSVRPAHPAASILLAEDNKINQMLAVRTLEKGGYSVSVANNGAEAVRMATATSFDLILMDIQMPEMDGFQATAAITDLHRSEGRKPVPVIAMTAHALKGDRARCLTAGMTDYLSKPVKPADLLHMVEQYTQRDT